MDNFTDEKSMDDLHSRINKIVKELLEKRELEIYGNLKVEVAEMDDLAVIKKNKIYINEKASKYPENILKYIVAHELAHLAVKKHTKKFWEILKCIYPEYEEAKKELQKLLKHEKLPIS